MFGDAFKDAINLLVAFAVIGALSALGGVIFIGFKIFKHFIH